MSYYYTPSVCPLHTLSCLYKPLVLYCHSHSQSVFDPVLVSILVEVLPTNIVCASYITHLYCDVLFSTEEGDVYVCGWNKNGQLGLASKQVDSPNICQVPSLPRKITKVSCGWNHTMALTKDGSVYVWGSNAFGQLGVPEIRKQNESPVQMPSEVYTCTSLDGMNYFKM